MKKVFRRLLILSLSLTALSGCDLFTFGGDGNAAENGDTENKQSEAFDAEVEAKGLDLRDYTKTVAINAKYKFDGKAYLQFENKPEVDVTDYCTFVLPDTSKAGNAKLKASYEGDRYIYSKTVYIEVTEPTLSSIDAEGYTDSVKYGETYTFDGRVIATYTDNSTKDVTSQATIGTLDTSSVGNKGLTISYSEGKVSKTIQKIIKVTNELVDIGISGYQSTYQIDEQFTFTGKVIAYYNDNIQKDVTSLATITHNVDTSKSGSYSLNALYEEDGITKEASVEITVAEQLPTLESIAASGYTTTVDKNGTYVFDGTVMATFDNGDVVDVTTDCTYPNLITTSKGTKNYKITYSDPYHEGNKKTTTIQIEVISRVTGISVASTLSLGVGITKALNASVTPSDANNKGLTYVTGNDKVATVDSSGNVYGVAVGNTIVTITSQDVPSISEEVAISVSAIDYATWTILLYVCGADLESDSKQGGAATEDLQEIASVSGQPSDVNIVVQAGGAKSWKSTYSSVISKDYCNRFHLKNKSYVKDSQTAKVNMGLQSSLQDFIEWGLEEYPAQNVGLILWNHGGAMSGCCYDEQYSDDPLTPSEVAGAVKTAKSNSNFAGKFEFIGYDCCLMQVQDIAGLNSEYAKYQVASEESEWGYGWTYDGWIDDLFAKKATEVILKEIVDTFKSETTAAYNQWGYTNDQTLSYLDLSKWDAYKNAWENMASTLSGVVNSSSKWSTFESLLNSCQRFGETEDYYGNTIYPFDVFDVGSFCAKIKTNSNYKNNSTLMSNISSVQTALSNLVSYEWHGSGSSGATGLAMFAPVSEYSSKSSYSTSSTPFTTWRTLCINYGSWN